MGKFGKKKFFWDLEKFWDFEKIRDLEKIWDLEKIRDLEKFFNFFENFSKSPPMQDIHSFSSLFSKSAHVSQNLIKRKWRAGSI